MYHVSLSLHIYIYIYMYMHYYIYTSTGLGAAARAPLQHVSTHLRPRRQTPRGTFVGRGMIPFP